VDLSSIVGTFVVSMQRRERGTRDGSDESTDRERGRPERVEVYLRRGKRASVF
jgi:hypothetical protein